ncbi:hypothetical protein MRX96_051165 [Rhipicephalus microplus]
MPVRIADYRAIVMTYAQAQRLIFAYDVASNIHPGNLLARLSAFCARALILPALDHAKDATFTSHAKRQGNLKRSDKNRLHLGSTSLRCRWGPLSPANKTKPGPSCLNENGALPVLPPSTHHHQQRLPVYNTLWQSLGRRQWQPELKLKQPELKPPPFENTSRSWKPRYVLLHTSHAIPTTPTPTTSQPPAPNPPTASSISFTPSHVNVTSSSDSVELDIDTQLPRHTNRDTTPRPSTHS